MKANELMIGDWAIVHGPADQRFTRKLDIGDLSFFVEFEPIPLTPEILEKNGFDYMSNSNYDYEDGYGHLVRYDSFNKRLRILRDLDVAYDSGDFADINVHQLQHALRLCGIDKEIVL